MAKGRRKVAPSPNMVRQEEVAARAGVSTSTVSRALTRPDLVTEETRLRVVEAAQALGYAPNQLARSLRKQGSQTIGLIISDILVSFHSEVAKGVEDVANEHGYSVILCNAEEDPDKEARYINLLRGFQVAGIIIEPAKDSAGPIEQVLRSGTQVVEVDRISGAQGVLSVLSDNLSGGKAAAEHLLKLGHRHFAVIAGDTAITSGRERLEGFRQGLHAAEVELETNRIALCTNTPDGGYQATRQLLNNGKLPSALFVQNAQMMAGVMRAMKELNIKIPGDISVISFDDTQWAGYVDPPLTVVAQQPYELGRTAARLILESIQGKANKQAQVVRLPTQMIERQSCKAVTG